VSEEPLWIFGYGSLVWRPAFDHAERVPAVVRGWARRFWQGSTDHRGVPGAPGRVVTLVREATATCWGMAYRVGPERAGDVLAGLDHREQGGYDREIVEIELQATTGRPGRVRALMYLATHENPNYLGPAPPHEIARQVVQSVGPSGPNREYVLRLAEALRDLRAEDPHVFEVESRVRAILGADGRGSG
jgi:cation transport regulator ChaC